MLLSPVQTSAGSNFLCSFDPEADTWNWTASTSNGTYNTFSSYAVSSDGNTVYAFDGYNIDVFDALTMAMKRTFPVSASQSLINYPTMFLSRDEKTVFITDGSSNGVLDAYDVSTGTFVGWMPQLNLAASGSYSGDTPIYQAMDQNGIAAGVITSEGVGFMDSTAVHTPPIGTPFMQTQLLVPYGPVGGGTADSWLPSIFGLSTPPPLGSVFFGANLATDLGNNSFEGAMIFAVNPAGTPGPVDVRTFSTDGGSQLLPAGFSYGPWILESPTMYSTAEGGSSATLYGYAFGPQTYTGGATYIAPPLDLQVTVGSTPATVTAFSPNPYVNDVYYSYFTAPPTPKNSLLVTIPPGTPGTTAGITVTNSTGSNGASTITYLGAVQQVPVNGELVDGIYDPYRDVYYFSDATQVRVFSLSQKQWQSSIPIPAPVQAYGPQRLWGLGLSPDGSKLAIADPGAAAIYVVNLNQSTVQSFPVATSTIVDPVTSAPIAPAITNQGIVYFATADFNGDGGRGYLFELDTSTGVFQEVTGVTYSDFLPTEGPYTSSRLEITADGSRIYLNDGGLPVFIDTSNEHYVWSLSFSNASYLGQGSYEAVLAPSQTRLFLDGFTTDTNLNPIALQALDTAQILDAAYVYGAAFSADGNLLFQPGLYAIDVFDGQTGVFRGRVGLPMQLAPNYRALVSNKRDSQLVTITGDTGNGIAVIDLNSIPEPPPSSYFSSAAPIAASVSAFHPKISLSNARKMRNALTRVPLPERKTGPLVRKLIMAHPRWMHVQ